MSIGGYPFDEFASLLFLRNIPTCTATRDRWHSSFAVLPRQSGLLMTMV